MQEQDRGRTSIGNIVAAGVIAIILIASVVGLWVAIEANAPGNGANRGAVTPPSYPPITVRAHLQVAHYTARPSSRCCKLS